MLKLKLADILEALTGVRPPYAEKLISSAVVDSRQAIPGGLFVALKGKNADGHDFVEEAFRLGACCALVERQPAPEVRVLDLRPNAAIIDFSRVQLPACLLVEDCLLALQQIARFWRRKMDLRVIGITGSVGKSTTKELTYEVLSQRFHTLKNSGNLNNEIGLPLTLLSLTDAHERAVLEMGFYVPGEIKLLCNIAAPQVGVITNIGTVHAERAGSQQMIAQGKSELVELLPPAPEGTAVLNFDDNWVRAMADQTQARVFFYGLDPRADLWADAVEGLGLDGIRFRLHYRKETIHLRVPLIGRHSVHTVLRATAVGLIEGLTWQEIVDGLRSEHTQLRLVVVRSHNGALILDDTYNASPESNLAALNLLEELEGRRIAVLGDMLELGQYEKSGHTRVGVRAAGFVDELITVGSRAHMIAEAARKSGLSPSAIHEYESTEEVVVYLREKLKPTDVALVKGSHGMRMDLIVSALEEGP